MIPRDFGKKLSEIQNVGVTITPGSPRGWTTRAVECYYNAAIIIIIINLYYANWQQQAKTPTMVRTWRG